MSKRQVEFFFDFGSRRPTRVDTAPGICASTGATLVLPAMLLGGVFQARETRRP